jgi:hypothetical protein
MYTREGNRARCEAAAPVSFYHIPPVLRAVVPAVCRLLFNGLSQT